MFEVICTGQNPNYGQKGEKKLLCDVFIINALKNEWITNELNYIGSKTNNTPSIRVEEKLLPFRKVDIIQSLNNQAGAIKRMKETIERYEVTNKRLIDLVKESKTK